jgi:putative transposase
LVAPSPTPDTSILAGRHVRAKDVEILVLRHQLEILSRKEPRPRFGPQDKALLAALSRLLPRDRWRCFLMRPETSLR